MKRNVIALVCVLITLCVVAVGCGGGGNSQAPQTSGGGAAPGGEGSGGGGGSGKSNLVLAISGEPRSIDPFGSNDSHSSMMKDQMFDTLFTQVNYEVVPQLVDTYSWVDDTTLELTVKEGVPFHNGEILSISDVLYTLQRATESEYTTWIVENIDIENTKILEDGKTLQIKLFQPKGDQLAALCFLYIVNEQTVEAADYDPEVTPVGTGPFVFEKQYKGDRIEFVKNENYWNGAPVVDLTVRIITEAASRTIEVESGGVDIIENVLPTDLPILEKSGDVVIHRAPNYSLNFVGFNCQVAPFDDARVRQAITYAVDKDAIVDAVYGGTGSVASGPINSVIWGYSDDVMKYTYDPDKAMALLADAGYPEGFSAKMTVSDNQLRMDTAEIMQNQLGKVGIQLEVEVLENATYLDRIVNSDFQMFALGWVTNTGDADYGLYETFHSSRPTWANTTRYSNPEVDKLLEEAHTSVDPEVRKNAYAQVQKILVEEAPEIFMWNGEEILAARSNVKGIVLAPSGRHNFATVYFE